MSAESTLPAFPAPAYEVVVMRSQLERRLRELLAAPVVAVDIETLGATKDVATDPRRGRIRLVSLSVPDEPTLVVDCAELDVRLLAPLFDGERKLLAHNAAFEIGFLWAAGIEPPARSNWFDTMIAAQLLAAGTKEGFINHAGLDEVVARELGYALDKTWQAGPWGGELCAAQLAYAATDSRCLLELASHQCHELRAAGLVRVSEIEMQALPFVAWTDRTGVPFDTERWQTLARDARAEADRLWRELNRLVGPRDSLDGRATNWRSAKQVLAHLHRHGYEVESTSDEVLAEFGPQESLPATIRAYRTQQRRASSYADKIVAAVHPCTGRIHPWLLQLGASASGRMSNRQPNVQGLPRDPRYRGCVRPADPSRVVVKCDYTSIELRIAAQLSQDRRLIEAFERGDDVLALTAQLVLGAGAEVSSTQRQYAKALAYGSLYGAGSETLRKSALKSYQVMLDAEQAAALQRKFFATYPGLKRWQQQRGGDPRDYARTLAGRRRLNVRTYTRKLNTPVQGSGADGIKTAFGRLWQHRFEAPNSVRPILLVHDEITLECDRRDAIDAAGWLERHMREGMAELVTNVPIATSLVVGQSWAGESLKDVEMFPCSASERVQDALGDASQNPACALCRRAPSVSAQSDLCEGCEGWAEETDAESPPKGGR
jgi:DNA polymerase-1